MIVDELKDSLAPKVSRVKHPVLDRFGVRVYIARLDCIVPFASGNKIYKLVGNLDKAAALGCKTLLSFGGAYSNHIHALALTAERYGFKSVGIIRGEEISTNPTLDDARRAGMQIVPVDRKTYRRRYDADYWHELQDRYRDAFIIPEGAANQESLTGTRLIPLYIGKALGAAPHTICVAAGSGATAAGIAQGSAESQSVRVYSVVRDITLTRRIERLSGLDISTPVTPIDASYAGYAKLDEVHIQFVLSWLEHTGILLDPIYTSRLCRKVLEELKAKDLPNSANIVLVHSGGLQGWRGFQSRVEKLAGVPAWQKIASVLPVQLNAQARINGGV